ncbi:MAG TPA: hypothetical protein VD789_11940, partial [Thermomicrobiales bacterium]|nr:hypothetical protein [Thermomicrobiales bacterium]
VANDQAPTFYTVDIRMDEAAGVDATTLTGIDVSDNVAWAQYPHRFLVTLDPQLDQGGSITYQVVDATTGETIGTLDNIPLDDDGSPGYPHLGWRSVVSSADGETEVIAFDTQHIYLMRAGNGEPQVRQIASPPGVAGSWPAVASMFLSPDGTMLSLTAEGDESQTRWLLPLDGEPDEWLEVPKTVASEDPGYILFVPGSSD